jgi:hypothetical protein
LDLQKGGRKEKYFLLFLLHPRKVQADLWYVVKFVVYGMWYIVH